MNFAALLNAMNQASGFELYRLRAAIDRVLADPKWIIAIRSQLRIGQEIEYFDARANKLRPAQVREFRTKEVLVRETDTGEHWLIAYTAINLEGVDVSIRDNPPQGLSRHEVAIGDTVGFLDHEHRQRSGARSRVSRHCLSPRSQGVPS